MKSNYRAHTQLFGRLLLTVMISSAVSSLSLDTNGQRENQTGNANQVISSGFGFRLMHDSGLLSTFLGHQIIRKVSFPQIKEKKCLLHVLVLIDDPQQPSHQHRNFVTTECTICCRVLCLTLSAPAVHQVNEIPIRTSLIPQKVRM